MILTGKGWHWTKRLAGSLASEGNKRSDLRTWNNCTLRCQWRHLRWEPQMTQRDRPWRKGCWITSANLTRKRTRQNSPLEFSLSTSLETQKLLLACFSSRRLEGETILSVTWVRTLKCISCTMEHSALNCWLTLSSVMRGTLSFYPEFMWPRNDNPQEEKVSLSPWVSLCFICFGEWYGDITAQRLKMIHEMLLTTIQRTSSRTAR